MSAGVHPLVTPVMGDAHAQWCPRCKAYTVACAPLYLLTPAGVTRAQFYALCEICDLDGPEVTRG
ncbi:hypothetical protein AQJ11_03135 [Streptomyces corchorusii]|uniref:Uncharacterized protein n=2 Tax=Streptomyces TaxID=1883 RepID=A0A101QMG1_STRCK|nr:hypothetical protein [Streptomyces corchorusii]KUN32535.1 hypothetical protein AQJ11_03135 [Streptomyces corchorusii]